MSINWTDGFEMYNAKVAGLGVQTRWTVPSAFTIATSGSRTGAQCLTTNNPAVYATRPVPASTSQGFAWAVFLPAQADNILFEFRESDVKHLSLRSGVDGSVRVLRGSVVLATSAPNLLNFSAWNFIEVSDFFCSDSAGAVTVKVNAAEAFSISGVDTQNGGTGLVNLIAITGPDGSRMDDCCSTTGPTYGDQGMFPIYADSDAVVQWVPNSGSNNYSRINELVPNGDMSYVQASMAGEVDQYGFQDLPSTITNVTAVNMIAYARKTDTGSRAFASRMEMGGDDFETADYGLSDTYARFETLMETAPDSAAWNRTKFNSITAGPKVTS